MHIDQSVVRHMASLARLHLNEEEIAAMEKDLNRILAYVEQLGRLDTSDVVPTSHVLGLRDVLREDEPRQSLATAAFLANAPAHEADAVKVPRVLDEH